VRSGAVFVSSLLSTMGSGAKKENDSCSICLEELVDNGERTIVHLRDCIHRFHINCISDWIQKSNTCPDCRRQMVIQGMYRLPSIKKTQFMIGVAFIVFCIAFGFCASILMSEISRYSVCDAYDGGSIRRVKDLNFAPHDDDDNDDGYCHDGKACLLGEDWNRNRTTCINDIHPKKKNIHFGARLASVNDETLEFVVEISNKENRPYTFHSKLVCSKTAGRQFMTNNIHEVKASNFIHRSQLVAREGLETCYIQITEVEKDEVLYTSDSFLVPPRVETSHMQQFPCGNSGSDKRKSVRGQQWFSGDRFYTPPYREAMDDVDDKYGACRTYVCDPRDGR